MNLLSKSCTNHLYLLIVVMVFGWMREAVASSGRAGRPSSPSTTTLALPSSSSSLRSNIVDTFSCRGLSYGYYADPDNDCQVFHICYPRQQVDGSVQMFKWSFICPAQTVFNQETLTCTRLEDAVPCQDVSAFYFVNHSFGSLDQPFSRNEI